MPASTTEFDDLRDAAEEAAAVADRQRDERVESGESLDKMEEELEENLSSVLARLEEIAKKRA